MRWTAAAQIPDQSGRCALVTGANSGIGFDTARLLALHGACVTLACRDNGRGQEAVARIQRQIPSASLELLQLDLGDLDSVAAAARTFVATHSRLDVLINNAGVMIPPFSRTRQGFELQFGTNHLGHFALTARLFPLLAQTSLSRIVVVSSAGANFGRINFDDLNFERHRYWAWLAYGQSKLANLIFARELARRVEAAGLEMRITAAHPGGSSTNLQRNSFFLRTFVNPLVMNPEEAAVVILRAAVDPEAKNGSYWAPAGCFEMKGPPSPAYVPKRAQNQSVARQLWNVSEALTQVTFPIPESGRTVDR